MSEIQPCCVSKTYARRITFTRVCVNLLIYLCCTLAEMCLKGHTLIHRLPDISKDYFPSKAWLKVKLIFIWSEPYFCSFVHGGHKSVLPWKQCSGIWVKIIMNLKRQMNRSKNRFLFSRIHTPLPWIHCSCLSLYSSQEHGVLQGPCPLP